MARGTEQPVGNYIVRLEGVVSMDPGGGCGVGSAGGAPARQRGWDGGRGRSELALGFGSHSGVLLGEVEV